MGGGGGQADPISKFQYQLLLVIDMHMKMLGFKFEQNRTISEEFNFLRDGAWDPHL